MLYTQILRISSKILGFAKWQYPGVIDKDQAAKIKTIEERFPDKPPTGYNMKLWNDIYAVVAVYHEKHVNDEKDYGQSGPL